MDLAAFSRSPEFAGKDLLGLPLQHLLDQGPWLVLVPVSSVALDWNLSVRAAVRGEYQITENAALGLAVAGAHVATAVGLGSGRQVVVNAVGDRGTISNCEGTAGLGGHGSGICHDSRGGNYRFMF